MAQQFLSWNRGPSLHVDTVTVGTPHPHSFDHVDGHDLSESMYIFPNPSSASPSICTSDFSVPMDFPASPLSALRSGDTSSHSCIADAELDIRGPPVGMSSQAGASFGATEPVDRWELLPRRRGILSTPTSLQHPQNPLPQSPCYHCTVSSTPHPLIRLPFLSVILSLFSVDDDTLYLITHPTSHPTLFSGLTLCAASVPLEESDTRHHKPLSSNESRVLKAGCEVACDPSLALSNPFWYSPLRLFSLTCDVVVGGGRALRKAFHG